ncbi:hypothetical protein ACFOD4_00285 [Pseudoroseomonas globiformis]|uniref:Uncharacterized protein n=1 Tax=Teichococcus globiformis TaxID=2307229 RepID=A0ABV7FVQ0_9PROT
MSQHDTQPGRPPLSPGGKGMTPDPRAGGGAPSAGAAGDEAAAEALQDGALPEDAHAAAGKVEETERAVRAAHQMR